MSASQRLGRISGLLVKERFCPLSGWRCHWFEPSGNIAVHRTGALYSASGPLERHSSLHLLVKAGFAVVADLGRIRVARVAVDAIGFNSPATVVNNGLRLTKRMATLPPSTELFCQCV